ncbi:c-type cytochrome [Herbaspirillum sp. HC18]|nr:c-type cytochrome [Herbaspirillum sp. HC18]
MKGAPLFSMRNPWFLRSVGAVIALALVSALVGFLWVPYRQAGGDLDSLWEAICRAAGAPAERTPAGDIGKTTSSDVIVVPRMIAADKISAGRGGTLALRCTMCHGTRGMSEANTPNLAGQDAESIYKQLRDLQSGHRKSEIMAPHARNLTDQEMRDLAAYYSELPRQKPPPSLIEQLKAPRIVQIGAPMRNVAPCISCHGGSDKKTATPLLDGEPEAYLRTQLLAFADGTRRNDIGGQMRNVARQMTREEIEQAVRYYAQR